MNPPQSRIKPPIRRKPAFLPSGEYVKVEPFGENPTMYRIVTKRFGNIVGARLDRGEGTYPSVPIICNSIAQATKSMVVWDAFCKLNRPKKKA